MAQRGSYAKGVAKREEILERTLDVIATEGYDGASVKRIAEAVGLSQAGLLHYFDSKEDGEDRPSTISIHTAAVVFNLTVALEP